VERPFRYKTLIVGYFFALTALIFSFIDLNITIKGFDDSYWLGLILTSASLILLAPPLFRYVFVPLLHGRFSVEILHFLALSLSFGISVMTPVLTDYTPFFHITALFLLVLPIISFWEAHLRRSSLWELREVLSLRVEKARLLKGSSETVVPSSQLQKNDIIRILPGERIPHDGIVIRGTTRVNENDITGSLEPIFKNRDDWVLAGTLNEDSVIDVQIKTEHSQNFLERIIKQWNIIRSEESPFQKRINWTIFCLIPACIFLASMILAFDIKRGNPNLGLSAALAILLVPVFSSLWRTAVISTNLGMAKALKGGIMFKSASSLFKVAKLDSLFFDKTGTITLGDFAFSQLFLEPGTNQGEVLSAFFSLGAQTDHPISRGIKTHPWYMEIEKLPVRNFKYMPGLGISASLTIRGASDKLVVIGSVRYLRRYQMQISAGMRDKIDLLESMGEIVVLCGWNGMARALISLSDTLRKDIKPLLEDLATLKVKPIVVTGDHDEMIAHLNQTKGISQVFTRCLPEEKIKKIKKFKDEKHRVGYIGTIHDDPSLLSSSDAGIIFHSGPADVIKNTEVAIFGNKLEDITNLIRIARKARKIVIFNTALGIVFTVGGIALSATHFMSPYMAILGMAGTSIILNITPMVLKTK